MKRANNSRVTPIYSFFPKSKSSANISENANDFYKQHLPKVSNNCSNSDASQQFANENQRLKEEVERLTAENSKIIEENKKLRSEFAGLLKVHKETCRLYVNKELKVKLLEKKILPEDELLYESFKDVLGESVVVKLRKLPDGMSCDSTLILNCVRSLFNNSDELKSVSASGTGENSMFPIEKRKILDAIFLERLSSVKMNDIDRNMRYMRLNRLINQAIANMSKPKVNKFNHMSIIQSTCKFQKNKFLYRSVQEQAKQRILRLKLMRVLLLLTTNQSIR